MSRLQKDIVVIAWNGVDEPLAFIDFDASPCFSILLFNYSGNKQTPELINGKFFNKCIHQKTEFKGALLAALAAHLSEQEYRFVGILDDDQEISISGLNLLLEEATTLNADLFQASVHHESYYSHACFLQKQNHSSEKVNWVEIMAPFLRKALFEAGLPFYQKNISSYGIDLYLFPYLQKKLGLNNTYLIHKVALKHNKPVTDGSKRFSNGLDARQEGELLREQLLNLIQEENIAFSDKELKQIYGVGTIRWDAIKYNIKRKLSFMY
jgi:hypothetical protein